MASKVMHCVAEAGLHTSGTAACMCVTEQSVQEVASSKHESEAGLVSCAVTEMVQLDMKAASHS